MKRQKKSKNPHSLGGRIISSSLFGVAIGLGLLCSLLCIFSAVCLTFTNPHPFILPLCLFSVYSSSFFAGLAAIKHCDGRDALLCGTLTGIILTVLLWGIFSLFGMIYGADTGSNTSIGYIWKFLIAPISPIGACLGVRRTKKVSREHRRKY